MLGVCLLDALYKDRQPCRYLHLVAIRLLIINYFCTIKPTFCPYPLRDFLPLHPKNFFYYYTPQRFFTPSEIFYLNPLRNFLPLPKFFTFIINN